MNKLFILLGTFLICLNLLASEGNIFLEVSGSDKPVSMTSRYCFNKFTQCEEALWDGKVCFTGNRGEAIDALTGSETADFWGGEYFITQVHYVGKKEISYTIFDGPNETAVHKFRISRCRK